MLSLVLLVFALVEAGLPL